MDNNVRLEHAPYLMSDQLCYLFVTIVLLNDLYVANVNSLKPARNWVSVLLVNTYII